MATTQTKAILLEEDGQDLLRFEMFPENPINLNSEVQSELRHLFTRVIEHLFTEKLEFILDIQDYNKQLFIDIATEYIKQLNSEITTVYDKIPKLD